MIDYETKCAIDRVRDRSASAFSVNCLSIVVFVMILILSSNTRNRLAWLEDRLVESGSIPCRYADRDKEEK